MGNFNRPENQSKVAFPIAPAGYPFIYAAAFATVIFALLGFKVLATGGLLATLFICYFFRDPDRLVPSEDKAVVSPADGRVVFAGSAEDPRFFEGPCLKVSIFMSIFNVHVNRAPHEGVVKRIDYFPGKFFAANLDKASVHNEHNAVYIETENGLNLCVVQIAGLIARRIICALKKGDAIIRGQRIGMICFGSRVDVYLPVDSRLQLTTGEKIKAGETVIAYLK